MVISIHAPRVGRDHQPFSKYPTVEISIHAPRVGRDFLSTRSRRNCRISIHAPRVGRDDDTQSIIRFLNDFNPRAPCGARLPIISYLFVHIPFQSTRPVWGATDFCEEEIIVREDFNPRAPCGARRYRTRSQAVRPTFQSTRPVWGATVKVAARPQPDRFQSTRPVWGATLVLRAAITLFIPFQSTRPVWGATPACETLRSRSKISIHAPRVGRDHWQRRLR